MSDTGTPGDTLQFDKAQYTTPAGATACSACKKAITDAFYTANSRRLCGNCYTDLYNRLFGGSKARRTFRATGMGLLAGLIGAGIWFGVRRISGYELGLIALLVGIMVGVAVRKGSDARGGWFYQSLAIALTYFCISIQYAPDLVEAGTKKYQKDHPTAVASADSPAGAADNDGTASVDAPKSKGGIMYILYGIVLLLLSLAFPIFAGFHNPIGLIILGIALYEAWKINKKPVFALAGPFAVRPG